MVPPLRPLRGLLSSAPHSAPADPDSLQRARLVARILEGGESPGRVSQALERGTPWSRAVDELSHGDGRSAIIEQFSLAVRLDNGACFSLLLSMGRRFERSDPEMAARIYHALQSVPSWSNEPGEARLVDRRLEVLRGGGTWGDRFERFAETFVSQAADPTTLIGIGVAGAAYRGVRLFAMSRLAAGGLASLPRSVLALASLAGFSAEVPAFSLSTALVDTYRGRHVDWSAHGVANSLFHGALGLGSMRLAQGVIGNLAHRYFRSADLGSLSLGTRLRIGATQQAGMLGGILLSQRVESLVSGHAPSSFADQLGEGLANLLVFNASGAVARRLYGARLANLERDVEIRSRQMALGLNLQATARTIDENTAALRRIPASDMAPVIKLHVAAPEVPGPRRLIPHIASLQAVFDPITPAREMMRLRLKIMGAARGSSGHILLNDAELSRTVLSDPQSWLRVGTPLKVPESHPHIILMSNSTPFINGDSWKMRRRIVMPAMSKRTIMADMAPIFESSYRDFTHDWLDKGRMNLTNDTMNITMRNNMRALMGLEPATGEAIAAEMQQFLRGFLSPTVLISQQMGGDRVIPFTPFARWLAQGDRLHRSLNSLLESKRANPSQDPIGMLIASTDQETGRPLSNAEVMGELVTFYAAGHETTARTLGWALWMLAHHPEAARRATQEVADVLQGRAPTYDELPKLRFLEAVLSESQRMIPVLTTSLPRGTLKDAQLGGISLPAGSNVAISVYAQHHNPTVFPEPGTFRPERWENHKFPAYQFLPLGMGPRQCAGSVFAKWQILYTMARMVQDFSFRPTTTKVDYTIFNTMTRPKGNLDLQVLVPGRWSESAPVTGSIRNFVYPGEGPR